MQMVWRDALRGARGEVIRAAGRRSFLYCKGCGISMMAAGQ